MPSRFVGAPFPRFRGDLVRQSGARPAYAGVSSRQPRGCCPACAAILVMPERSQGDRFVVAVKRLAVGKPVDLALADVCPLLHAKAQRTGLPERRCVLARASRVIRAESESIFALSSAMLGGGGAGLLAGRPTRRIAFSDEVRTPAAGLVAFMLDLRGRLSRSVIARKAPRRGMH